MENLTFAKPHSQALRSPDYTPLIQDLLNDVIEEARQANRNDGTAAVGIYGGFRRNVLLDHPLSTKRLALYAASNFEGTSTSIVPEMHSALKYHRLCGAEVSFIVDLLNPLKKHPRFERMLELPEGVALLASSPGLRTFPVVASKEDKRRMEALWIRTTQYAFETAHASKECLVWAANANVPGAVQFRDKVQHPFCYCLSVADGLTAETVVDGRYAYGRNDIDSVAYMTNDRVGIQAFEDERCRESHSGTHAAEIFAELERPETLETAKKWIRIHLEGVSDDADERYMF